MKQLKNVLAIFVIFSVVMACQTSTSSDQSSEAEDAKPEKKKLTQVDKAENTFTNFLSVYTGMFTVMMSNMMGGMAESMSEGMTGEEGESSEFNLDGLDESVISKLDSIIMVLGNAFTELEKEDKAIYNKMFKNELMEEGVALTEKYELPEGYKPLCENLSKDDIKKYVSKALSDPQMKNTEDPVLNTLKDLSEWYTKVAENFEADPDISKFMPGMK